MKKTVLTSSIMILGVLAAGSLMQGCRTYQPGSTSSRRTLLGNTLGDENTVTARVLPAKPERTAPAVAPETKIAAPEPVKPQSSFRPVAVETAPTVAPVAPAPAVPPAVVTTAPAAPVTATPAVRPEYAGTQSGLVTSNKSNAISATPVVPAPAFSGAPSGYIMYTVKEGDSAGKIANSHGMKLAEFTALNKIENPNHIRIGQTVKVYANRKPLAAGPAVRPAPVSVPGQTYVVQSGDSLSVIAHKNGMTTDALMKLNGIKDANRIRVGQKLYLSASAANAVTAVKAEASAAAESKKTEAPKMVTTPKNVPPPKVVTPEVVTPAVTVPADSAEKTDPAGTTEDEIVINILDRGLTGTPEPNVTVPAKSTTEIKTEPVTAASPVQVIDASDTYTVSGTDESLFTIALSRALKPYQIRQANPEISETEWEKLPKGKVIKLPPSRD